MKFCNRVNTHEGWWTRDKVRTDVFVYIECFYNVKRRYSTLGGISRNEFEEKVGIIQSGMRDLITAANKGITRTTINAKENRVLKSGR